VRLQEAKGRVYTVELTAPQAKPELNPVLEEQPKWLLLQQIAGEIQLQRGLLVSQTTLSDARPSASTTPEAMARVGPTLQSSACTHVSESAPPGSAKLPLDEGQVGRADDRRNSGLDSRKHAGQNHDRQSHTATEMPGQGDDGAAEHAWIRHLSGDAAKANAEAPVLVVVKELHLVSELRSVLSVRVPSRSAAGHIVQRNDLFGK
jgi:hypothetical protein